MSERNGKPLFITKKAEKQFQKLPAEVQRPLAVLMTEQAQTAEQMQQTKHFHMFKLKHHDHRVLLVRGDDIELIVTICLRKKLEHFASNFKNCATATAQRRALDESAVGDVYRTLQQSVEDPTMEQEDSTLSPAWDDAGRAFAVGQKLLAAMDEMVLASPAFELEISAVKEGLARRLAELDEKTDQLGQDSLQRSDELQRRVAMVEQSADKQCRRLQKTSEEAQQQARETERLNKELSADAARLARFRIWTHRRIAAGRAGRRQLRDELDGAAERLDAFDEQLHGEEGLLAEQRELAASVAALQSALSGDEGLARRVDELSRIAGGLEARLDAAKTAIRDASYDIHQRLARFDDAFDQWRAGQQQTVDELEKTLFDSVARISAKTERQASDEAQRLTQRLDQESAARRELKKQNDELRRDVEQLRCDMQSRSGFFGWLRGMFGAGQSPPAASGDDDDSEANAKLSRNTNAARFDNGRPARQASQDGR